MARPTPDLACGVRPLGPADIDVAAALIGDLGSASGPAAVTADLDQLAAALRFAGTLRGA